MLFSGSPYSPHTRVLCFSEVMSHPHHQKLSGTGMGSRFYPTFQAKIMSSQFHGQQKTPKDFYVRAKDLSLILHNKQYPQYFIHSCKQTCQFFTPKGRDCLYCTGQQTKSDLSMESTISNLLVYLLCRHAYKDQDCQFFCLQDLKKCERPKEYRPKTRCISHIDTLFPLQPIKGFQQTKNQPFWPTM